MMLVIFTMLLLSYGALTLQGNITAPTKEKISNIFMGDKMMECMKTAFDPDSNVAEDDPEVNRLETKLNLYSALFIIVQIGILYLGSAFIVRKFNQAQKKDADNNSASQLSVKSTMKEELWGSINLDTWKDTPCISNCVANENDIANGIAVFSVPSGSRTFDIKLPRCVIQTEEDTGKKIPAIAIQAEEVGDDVYVGVRYLDGGNGACTLPEIELLDSPNELFRSS